MAPSDSIPTTSVTPASHDSSSSNSSNKPPPVPSKHDPTESSQPPPTNPAKQRLKRPTLGTRKSSGTIIIPRDSPTVEVKDEHYDEGDARAMSPRRSSEELDRMGQDARQALEDQANALQSNLLEMIERVDSVKSEHEKLDSGNKFLQSYIGELMQTSKVNPAGAPKPKGKGRQVK